MCTDEGQMCCPSRLRPRPATLVMEKNQADVAAKADSVIHSKKIMQMVTVDHSCASLLTSDDDYCNKQMSQKGKEFASNEDISHIRVCGKKRKGLCQNLEQLDAISSRNLVEQGDHNGRMKEKQKRMQNDLLNNSHSSSEVTSCQENCINTNDDSVRRNLRSGRSATQQMRTSADYKQSMKRYRSSVFPKLLDGNQNPICSNVSKASEDYQGPGFSDCSAENSNISCNFSGSSLSFEGTSHSSCESGRGTLEPEDGLEDVDMLSESWDNFKSIRSVGISCGYKFSNILI